MVHDRSTQPPPGSRENRSHVQSVADSRPRRWCALSLLRLLSQQSVERGFFSGSSVYVPRLILIGHDGHQEHVVSRKISLRGFARLVFAARRSFPLTLRAKSPHGYIDRKDHRVLIIIIITCFSFSFGFYRSPISQLF